MLTQFLLAASKSAWYYSCRHTYESTLLQEMALAGISGAKTLCPGLVRVPEQEGLSLSLDPTYALQVLPNAIQVSGVSVSELARNVQDSVMLDQDLLPSSRGSLHVHCLVPEQLKGNPKPKMARRAQLVQDKLEKDMKKRFAFARPSKSDEIFTGDPWLLQLLLLEPEMLMASLTKCRVLPVGGTWPNWNHPGGLAPVDITEPMPSSAYRKLLEALACMEAKPLPSDRAVDLGACPGGWTQALRRYGCSVVAVDKSPLAQPLMQDPQVTFVKGDAFTFQPDEPVDWMVSDVIAYPERVRELLDRWCGSDPAWANRLVVTMKFQGEVDWQALRAAEDQALGYGFAVRSKHFFNNKNEVTLCLAQL